MKKAVQRHIEESIPLVKERIEQLQKEIDELAPELDIVIIARLLEKQFELNHLNERLVRMLEEMKL